MNVVRQLIWDDENIEHIAYHAITPEEVEEACHGNPVVRRTRQQRLLLVGRTFAGEYLTVILDPEGNGVYYPVTARPATRVERRYYQKQKAGESR